MAVYEHTYKPYTGKQTPTWSRFLIIPQHAYQDIFKSKIFTAFYASSFFYPLGCALFIYLHYNLSALELLGIPQTVLLPINLDFFYYILVVQGMFAFFINLVVGPVLVSRDLANNAIPLYLCRPFSRFEYVIGKMSVLLILSAFTWIPGLLLFGFQGYLAGWQWVTENYAIAPAIFIGFWIWLLILCLLSQALSAYIKYRMAASAVLLGIFFVPSIMAEVINALFRTRLGNMLSLRALIRTVWAGLFAHPNRMEMPLMNAWVVLALICAACLFILFRKVRAYEVVS